MATVGNGTAAPNSGTYDYGTVVTLTATADLGSIFTDWNGDVISTTNPVTLTMNSDKFITATFTLNHYELNLATVSDGSFPTRLHYAHDDQPHGHSAIRLSPNGAATWFQPPPCHRHDGQRQIHHHHFSSTNSERATVGNGTAAPNSSTYDYDS